MKSFLMVLAISGMMFGCSSSKTEKEKSAELPTYTESELGNDHDTLGKSASNLEMRGLVRDANGRSWEPTRYERFKALPVTQQKAAIADLELLKSLAATFLGKYNPGFNLQKADGSLTRSQVLKSEVATEAEEYRQLAISELERLNKLQESDTDAAAPAPVVTPPKKEDVKPPVKPGTTKPPTLPPRRPKK